MSPEELKTALRGLLAFPATPFTTDLALDRTAFRTHLEFVLAPRRAPLFVAGGAGEFFSLAPDEIVTLTRDAVDVAAGSVPVVVGVGFGAGIAPALAEAVESAGAAGVLVFPPYLVDGEQEGLLAYYRAIATRVRIGVIVYARGNVTIEPDAAARLTELGNVIAIKDGAGDIAAMQAIQERVGDRLTIVNGTPTAEMQAPAFADIGVRAYSSALHNFLPAFAWRFCDALQAGDDTEVHRLTDRVVRPIAEIRARRRGYAVSLVKAGLSLIGRDVGPLRPPLVPLAARDQDELARVISDAAKLL